METLGNRLKDLRNARNLTQSEVALSLKISTTCYAGYEQDYREPDLKTLKKLCDFFEVSADYLLCRTN